MKGLVEAGRDAGEGGREAVEEREGGRLWRGGRQGGRERREAETE